jgi:hypothetical protein
MERSGTRGKERVGGEKKVRPRGPKRGGEWMTHGSRGKAEGRMK